MDASDLGLAVIPPALAILVERLNPVNSKNITSSAQKDFKSFEGVQDFNAIFNNIVAFASGAVEVSGLAPTFVAGISSGFAIIHTLEMPFWPAIIYVVMYISLFLLIFNRLSGHSFMEIESRPAIDDAGDGSNLSLTGSKFVQRCIYLINSGVIVVSFAVFFVSNNPLEPMKSSTIENHDTGRPTIEGSANEHR